VKPPVHYSLPRGEVVIYCIYLYVYSASAALSAL
jgi:hypothetical protein